MTLGSRTEQFLFNLNNNYQIQTYADGTTTFNQGDVIAPFNLNRVYFTYFFQGIVPFGNVIGFVNESGVVLPLNLGSDSNGLNISFNSIMPMQEIRAMQALAAGLICYGVIRVPIGGD